MDDRRRSLDGIKVTVGELATAEPLLDVPVRSFPAELEVERTVSPQCLVSFDGNLYSVTPGEARWLAARPWMVNDFDFAAQPGVDEKPIRNLATLRFLNDASNVLFVGPPGVGKTMLSVALGRAAVDAGHRV